MMKKQTLTLTLAACAAFTTANLLAADGDTDADSYLTVSGVTLRPQTPSQSVLVDYTLSGGAAFVRLDIVTNGVSIGMDKIKSLSGDVSLTPTNVIEPGTHRITWDAKTDWPQNLSTQAQAKVWVAYTNHMEDLYLVIDLSKGAEAASYPVSYSFNAPDVSADPSCASNKLWLKYVEPGTFSMGSLASEQAYGVGSAEPQHLVKLTKPFFAGVFEVTRAQFLLVMGKECSDANSHPTGDSLLCPANIVDYYDMRGTGMTVTASSFVGRLRAKVAGFGFDLSTEAQWEYTCRAGTTGAWNNGTTITNAATDANLDKLAWYRDGLPATQPVGGKEANAWGFYDMHGNAWEMCLDYANAYDTSVSPAVDPVSTTVSASGHIDRGGGVSRPAYKCRSAYRGSDQENIRSVRVGFRLFCPLH